ncbi:hypothetical protein RUM44_010384 [Polyplax serrata]|uniref:Uncharacterized protein n=1 Tax=Polyplax serrata TaxID=468196 RepID=A0ABR1AX55_POLSC
MSHPDYDQTSHDHCSILVLIKHIGEELKPKSFNKVFDKISKINRIKIVDSSGHSREIWARYIKEYPVENNDWGDFQTHRRLLGLITVGKCNTQIELNELCRIHESLKVKYVSTLFDSQCIIFGLTEDKLPVNCKTGNTTPFTTPSNFKTRGHFYPDVDNFVDVESHVNDFLSSLFWVLESKRQERCREKIDKVSLLLAPFEKKDFVGLDLESKTNKKRCVGRMTKHLGDLSLQVGLLPEALGFYHSAVDILRAVNDWLWLGGALEGLCSASALVLYPHLHRTYSLHRNSSLQDGSPTKSPKTSLSNGIAGTNEVVNTITNNLPPSDIPKYYREAILHYSKYQNAGIIETESCFKAARISIEQGMTLHTAMVLQNVVFINLQLSEQEKIQRFTMLADLYKQIGFHRKASFCSRLAATRFVSSQNPTPDWTQCYNFILQALAGHKMTLDPIEFTKDGPQGWASLQIQLLRELVVAARRMDHPALATRHMTFLLQTLWSQLSHSDQRDFALQLQQFASQCEGSPVPLVLDSGVVIPPANLMNIPEAKTFQLENLLPHLRPQKIEKLKEDSGPFLFTPINFGSLDRRNNKSGGKLEYVWVEGDICEVMVKFLNPLPFDLKVSDVRLLTSGVVFESIPTSISIPPESGLQLCTLSGIPKEVGDLEILGYSTHTLGVKSNCKLKHIRGFQCTKFSVEVIPALPQIAVTTSLPKSLSCSSLGNSSHVVTSASLTLYAGETSECTITITNNSQHSIELLEVTMQSVLDPELQAQTFHWDKESLLAALPIKPGSSTTFTLKIQATADFLAPAIEDTCVTYGTGGGSQPNSLLGSALNSVPSHLCSPSISKASRTDPSSTSFRSTGSSSRSGSSMRLPPSPISKVTLPYSNKYTEAQLKIRYSGGPGLEAGYCRMSVVSINLEVLPSIHITGWDVLPAETSTQFYLVLDIANMTNHELELQYATSKSILMEGNESCRIPVPIDRCPLSKLSKLYSEDALTLQDRLELSKICSEHIASLADIRWILPSTGSTGKPSLKGISLTADMLDVVRMSPLQWDVTLNSQQIKPQEDLSYQIGECLQLGVTIHNYLEKPLKKVTLILQCYQDFKNGNINYRLETRLAYSGADKVLIPLIEQHKSVYHEYNLVFFNCGQFKIGMQCTSQEGSTSTSDRISHSWKYIPPIEINIVE